MKIPCFRCDGKGVLPQYSWNKNGICFTCGGDGVVNTFSTIKLNKMTMRSEMRDYLKHSSNRDIASVFANGENLKLKETQHLEMRAELKDRADNFYGLSAGNYPSYKELGQAVLTELDKREKAMPETYKKSPYWSAGKISLVPVHWLQKFQGNSLRRDKGEMKDFANQLLEEGLKDPVLIIIGQQDRNVTIGEGNHRTFAHIQAGLDYVPARVARQNNAMGTYYDKMSRVPKDDYFKADASPEEVFDTFYDHEDLPPEPAPKGLENHKEVPNSFLEAREPGMYGSEDELGVDITFTNLKEDLGIKYLWIEDGEDSEEESETLKGIAEHFWRVYGHGRDVVEYLINDEVLKEVDGDKLGEYSMNHQKSVDLFEILASYETDMFNDKKKRGSSNNDDDELAKLMEELGF